VSNWHDITTWYNQAHSLRSRVFDPDDADMQAATDDAVIHAHRGEVDAES
jgi:hypothetical protein